MKSYEITFRYVGAVTVLVNAENEIDAVEDARELYEDSVTFVNTNEESIFIEERHEGVDIKEV